MTSDLKSATLNTLVSMCILSPMASEVMATSKDLRGHMTLNLKSANMNTLESMCIMPPTASEAKAASKLPQRSYDLRFEISNLDYPGIHVHNASNGL